MASFKTKALGVLILLIVVGLAVAGGYGWKTWKQYQAAQALQRAESLLSEGQAAEADRLLDTLILGAPNPEAPWIDGALAMRLFALEQLGDPAAQTALASRVMAPDAPWGEPTGATLAWGHLILGRAALDQKQADPAREHFETFLALPRPAVPEPYAPSPYEAELGLARLQLADAAQFETGRERLQTLLENPDALPAPVRQKAEEILGLVNIRTLLNRQPQDDDQLYQIERGDTIDGMARRFRVSGDLITRVNGITNPRALTIGRRLKIPNLDLSIVVNKSDNTLTLYNDGKFFKKYSRAHRRGRLYDPERRLPHPVQDQGSVVDQSQDARTVRARRSPATSWAHAGWASPPTPAWAFTRPSIPRPSAPTAPMAASASNRRMSRNSTT